VQDVQDGQNVQDASDTVAKAPKALIVDDDPAVVDFLRARFIKLGFEVREASVGLQALIMARRDRPDVLIVDVNIPGLDGLSLSSSLLGPDSKALHVIVISGLSESETLDRCESLGAIYAAKGPELWNNIRGVLGEIFPEMKGEIAEKDTEAAGHVRQRPVILVIDDDPDVGEFIVSRLRKCNADAILANNGARGFQIAVREKPSLIISDCFMPDADINFLLSRLRSTPGVAKTPVFALTARKMDRVTEETLIKGFLGQRGVERIFKKPPEIKELFTAVQSYCAINYGTN
jgi:CheY-like chemotaxis protein